MGGGSFELFLGALNARAPRTVHFPWAPAGNQTDLQIGAEHEQTKNQGEVRNAKQHEKHLLSEPIMLMFFFVVNPPARVPRRMC